MRRILAASATLTACLFSTSAHAFAPDASGIAETGDLRPPSKAAIGHDKASFMAATGDSSQEGDGSFTFLGSESLPVGTFAFDAAGNSAHPVMTYFKNKVGNSKVELQQTSENTSGKQSTVSFIQTLGGVPILGTYALAHINAGKVTYARHYLVTPPKLTTTPAIDADTAMNDALMDVRSFAQDGNVTKAPELAIFYVLGQPTLVWQVPVTTQAPFASYDEYVDAQASGVVGRHKVSLDAVAGSVQANVEPTCEGEAPVPTNIPYVQWTPGRATNAQGQFQSPSNISQAQVKLNGAYFSIYSADSRNYTWAPELQQAPATNDIFLNSMPLGQVDPYVYLNQARSFMRNRALTTEGIENSNLFGWFASQVQVNANLPSGYAGFSCNAFYDPGSTSLNFYVDYPAWGCNNSGRSNKIVYHEYGHSIHHHLTANNSTFNLQMSEGVADYAMATITNDPNVTGLTGCNNILSSPGSVRPYRPTIRTCVNHYTYCGDTRCDAFPGDEVHHSAPVMCGALWDMRTQLMADLGADDGAEKADQIFLRFLSYATDMSSAYTAAIAADDDDDGDPSNGTNHSCAINKAFLGDDAGFAHFPGQVIYRVPCVKVKGRRVRAKGE